MTTGHRTYSQNDDVPQMDGDRGFIGVDMRTAPQLLQPGYVADARNARFRFGVAEPRKGMMPLSFSDVRGFEWDIEWQNGDINWQRIIGTGAFEDVYGVGVWNDPDGYDWFLIASSTNQASINIWRFRPGNSPEKIPVSVSLTVPTTSEYQDTNTEDLYWFTQAFDKCILSRGPNEKHLVLSNFEEGFIEAPGASGAGGTENIPNAKNSLFFQNRLIVPHVPSGGNKGDHVAVSDILDYTSYDPVYSSFKINQGDSDEIVRCVKFNDTTVIVFKDTSIYAVSNLIGDWESNATLDQITTEYGLVGQRSVASIGGDLWFLSQRGVVSLKQTELNKLQGVTLPQSSQIQPVIDKIDFSIARETACGAYWRDRYYLSVPIDGSQKNNAVLVYDFLNQAWAGYDDGDAVEVKYFFIADWQGSEHLFYVTYSGVVGLYEYGELEGVPIAQNSFYCDVLLKGHPEDGSTLQVNNGTSVRVTRHLEIIDDADNELVNDAGDNVIESLETNVTDAESGELWGVGTDSSVDPCEMPADNLWDGFNTDGWTHNTDSISQLDCGVRFTNSSSFYISSNDPYVQVICTNAYEVEDRPIDFMVLTRGYGFEAGNRRRIQQAKLFISTWAPKYKVTAVVDGVLKETVLVDDTTYTFPSRTKYLTFGIDDWDIANPNQDHATEGREDYSVVLEPTEPNGGTLLDADGTQLDMYACLLYTSPSPRDRTRSRMPSSA